MATDGDGNPAKAGCKIEYRLFRDVKLLPLSDLEAKAVRFKQQGIKALGVAGGDLALISWKDYVAKGYAE